MLTPIRALQVFQVLRFGAFFLTGVVLAQLGAGAYQIGIYESLIFLGSMFSFAWLSGLSQSLLAGQSGAGRPREFFNVFLVLCVCAVAASLLFRTSVTPFSILTNKPEMLWHGGLFAWYVMLAGPASLAEYVLLIKERSRELVAYGASVFMVQLACVALPLVWGMGLDGVVAGLTLSAALRFVYVLVLLLRFAEFKVDRQCMGHHLRMSAPLMVSALLSGSAEYLDGIIVSRLFSEEDFAIYRYGAKELPLVLLLANAFSNGMVARVAQDTQQALYEIRAGSQRMMHLLFPISIVLMLVSGWAYPKLFSMEFAASATVFNISLLLIISRLFFPQAILIGLRHTDAILRVSAIGIGVNMVLSVALAMLFGLEGVVWATLITFSLEKVLLARVVRQRTGTMSSVYFPWRTNLIYSILLALSFVVSCLIR